MYKGQISTKVILNKSKSKENEHGMSPPAKRAKTIQSLTMILYKIANLNGSFLWNQVCFKKVSAGLCALNVKRPLSSIDYTLHIENLSLKYYV